MDIKIKQNQKLLNVLVVMTVLLLGFSSCNKETEEEKSTKEESSLITYETKIIPGEYIVILNEASQDLGLRRNSLTPEKYTELVVNLSENIVSTYANDAKLNYIYSHTVSGFAVTMDAEAVAKLKLDPRVALVENDQEINLGILNKGKKPGGGDGGTTEPPPAPSQVIPYGIKRINGQHKTYSGNNVVYIIDTGIELDHPDLNVSTIGSFNAFTKGKDGGSVSDFNGHGTHVAGTVGAIDNDFGVIGVAPNVPVIPIKVLDSRGSGTISGVMAGVDHVAKVAKAGDVANMSLGSGVSPTLDKAVTDLADKGVKVAIAAGNSSADANNASPARVNHINVFTVSAMNSSDVFADFSNFGNPPIDFCAPGVGVNSTWIGKSYNSISGTSMAAPHVAGMLLFNYKPDGFVNKDRDNNPDPIWIVD
jgi:subtilisin family serine protease